MDWKLKHNVCKTIWVTIISILSSFRCNLFYLKVQRVKKKIFHHWNVYNYAFFATPYIPHPPLQSPTKREKKKKTQTSVHINFLFFHPSESTNMVVWGSTSWNMRTKIQIRRKSALVTIDIFDHFWRFWLWFLVGTLQMWFHALLGIYHK